MQMIFCFIFIQNLFGLSEILSEANKHGIVSFVDSPENTVHYIQTKIYDIYSGHYNAYKSGNVKTNIEIYKNNIYEPESIVYSDEKYSKDNTFFFTASSSGRYHIVVKLINVNKKGLGIECRHHAGEANKPNIISNSDVEISNVETAVNNLLKYIRNNVKLWEEEPEYKVYSDIIRLAWITLILKIISTAITVFYSNWKTKKFYSSEGVINK